MSYFRRCQSENGALESELNRLKSEAVKIERAKEAAERVKSEMEQSKRNAESELVSIKRASLAMSREREKLKQEHDKAKAEVAKVRHQSAALVGELSRVQSKGGPGDEIARLTKDLQQCRAEVQRLRAKQPVKPAQKDSATKTLGDSLDGGDFARASEMLIAHMEKQIRGKF